MHSDFEDGEPRITRSSSNAAGLRPGARHPALSNSGDKITWIHPKLLRMPETKTIKRRDQTASRGVGCLVGWLVGCAQKASGSLWRAQRFGKTPGDLLHITEGVPETRKGKTIERNVVF